MAEVSLAAVLETLARLETLVSGQAEALGRVERSTTRILDDHESRLRALCEEASSRKSQAATLADHEQRLRLADRMRARLHPTMAAAGLSLVLGAWQTFGGPQ